MNKFFNNIMLCLYVMAFSSCILVKAMDNQSKNTNVTSPFTLQTLPDHKQRALSIKRSTGESIDIYRYNISGEKFSTTIVNNDIGQPISIHTLQGNCMPYIPNDFFQSQANLNITHVMPDLIFEIADSNHKPDPSQVRYTPIPGIIQSLFGYSIYGTQDSVGSLSNERNALDTYDSMVSDEQKQLNFLRQINNPKKPYITDAQNNPIFLSGNPVEYGGIPQEIRVSMPKALEPKQRLKIDFMMKEMAQLEQCKTLGDFQKLSYETRITAGGYAVGRALRSLPRCKTLYDYHKLPDDIKNTAQAKEHYQYLKQEHEEESRAQSQRVKSYLYTRAKQAQALIQAKKSLLANSTASNRAPENTIKTTEQEQKPQESSQKSSNDHIAPSEIPLATANSNNTSNSSNISDISSANSANEQILGAAITVQSENAEHANMDIDQGSQVCEQSENPLALSNNNADISDTSVVSSAPNSLSINNKKLENEVEALLADNQTPIISPSTKRNLIKTLQEKQQKRSDTTQNTQVPSIISRLRLPTESSRQSRIVPIYSHPEQVSLSDSLRYTHQRTIDQEIIPMASQALVAPIVRNIVNFTFDTTGQAIRYVYGSLASMTHSAVNNIIGNQEAPAINRPINSPINRPRNLNQQPIVQQENSDHIIAERLGVTVAQVRSIQSDLFGSDQPSAELQEAWDRVYSGVATQEDVFTVKREAMQASCRRQLRQIQEQPIEQIEQPIAAQHPLDSEPSINQVAMQSDASENFDRVQPLESAEEINQVSHLIEQPQLAEQAEQPEQAEQQMISLAEPDQTVSDLYQDSADNQIDQVLDNSSDRVSVKLTDEAIDFMQQCDLPEHTFAEQLNNHDQILRQQELICVINQAADMHTKLEQKAPTLMPMVSNMAYISSILNYRDKTYLSDALLQASKSLLDFGRGLVSSIGNLGKQGAYLVNGFSEDPIKLSHTMLTGLKMTAYHLGRYVNEFMNFAYHGVMSDDETFMRVGRNYLEGEYNIVDVLWGFYNKSARDWGEFVGDITLGRLAQSHLIKCLNPVLKRSIVTAKILHEQGTQVVLRSKLVKQIKRQCQKKWADMLGVELANSVAYFTELDRDVTAIASEWQRFKRNVRSTLGLEESLAPTQAVSTSQSSLYTEATGPAIQNNPRQRVQPTIANNTEVTAPIPASVSGNTSGVTNVPIQRGAGSEIPYSCPNHAMHPEKVQGKHPIRLPRFEVQQAEAQAIMNEFNQSVSQMPLHIERVKHVLEPDIRCYRGQYPKPSGWHHDYLGQIKKSNMIKVNIKKTSNWGAYAADWVFFEEQKFSCFFPDNWTRRKVFKKIQEAAQNVQRKIPQDNKNILIEGVTKEGYRIDIIVSEIGDFISAYPNLDSCL